MAAIDLLTSLEAGYSTHAIITDPRVVYYLKGAMCPLLVVVGDIRYLE